MRQRLMAVLLALPLVVLAGRPQTVVLDVQHMTCGLCPITVKKALEKVPGVGKATVDFTKKTATVSFDPDQANTAALIKATTNAGYPSTVHK
ncbi:MAG: mercury resistance system periplasmic binding protein MerP [Pseudogulbenkiania sp.]|nr:mercury resistance system periplasmic binding protein MerP [Pseudogulbenkiania sp.]